MSPRRLYSTVTCPTGGEDDDRGGVHVCHLLAAVPRLLPAAPVLPRHVRGEVHPAGVPGHHVAGDELHHVQPHHLLLPQRQVSQHTVHGLTLTLTGAAARLTLTITGPEVVQSSRAEHHEWGIFFV